MSIFGRIWCRLTFHRHQGRSALGSYMTRRGPRYLYQCRGCGDYYSESW
jgi:hypothetical protein